MHRAGCQRWDLRRSVPSAQHMVARASATGAALKGGKLRGGTLPRWDRVADEASSALCERGGCNNPPSSSQAMNRRGVKQPCSDHPICGQHQLASVLDGGGGGRCGRRRRRRRRRGLSRQVRCTRPPPARSVAGYNTPSAGASFSVLCGPGRVKRRVTLPERVRTGGEHPCCSTPAFFFWENKKQKTRLRGIYVFNQANSSALQ